MTIEISDQQIRALLAEAGSADDQAMVAFCLVALGHDIDSDLDAGNADQVRIANERRDALERRGIIPEHIGADDMAREECARAIAEAEAQGA